MLNITDLVDELQDQIRWQKTPEELELSDYEQFVVHGLKRLYIDTGRASSFDHNSIVRDAETDHLMFYQDLQIDEEEYVLICAQIQFFKRVATDVNRLVGYTTNALSVTNSDKPYANLKDSIEKLET